jgi:hypothetical protein
MPTITRTVTHPDKRSDRELATEKQVMFARKLIVEKIYPRLGADRAARIARFEQMLPTMTKQFASALIGDLVVAAVDRTPIETTIREAAFTLTPGVYEVNGEIFNVKWNQRKTNMYAQRLAELPNVSRLAVSGDEVHFEFEYAPGVIKRLRPHHKMSIERAEELTIRYGRCLVCGRRLKTAESVKRGIGPVCRATFA